jgi:hypothetical protein
VRSVARPAGARARSRAAHFFVQCGRGAPTPRCVRGALRGPSASPALPRGAALSVCYCFGSSSSTPGSCTGAYAPTSPWALGASSSLPGLGASSALLGLGGALGGLASGGALGFAGGRPRELRG